MYAGFKNYHLDEMSTFWTGRVPDTFFSEDL